MSEATYKAGEMYALTGISRRQLELWEQKGYFVPAKITGTGNGSRRRYDQANVTDIKNALAFIEEGYRVPVAWERVRRWRAVAEGAKVCRT